MPLSWLNPIFSQHNSPSTSLTTQSPQLPSPATILATYKHTLDNLNDDPQTLLAVLLIRDQVKVVFQQTGALTPKRVMLLQELDSHLRQTQVSLDNLSTWRDSLHPIDTPWWWQLDQAHNKKEQEKDLIWEILAVTFFILTVPLIVDIIQRLWTNVPDNVAIFGTLLTLLVTASPFTSRGRELTQWALKRVSQLPTHRHAETKAMTAFLALMFVATGYYFLLPQYARSLNARGFVALEQGNLTTAGQQFRRATAINKDFSVAYYNLATQYEATHPDEAMAWYQEALAHNLEFTPAYNNLGRLYLQQDKKQQAVIVLQMGLERLRDGDSAAEIVTRYQSLTHLGQAYFELEEMETAVSILQQAIALESHTQLDPAFYRARPHYYLALAYEALEQPTDDIIREWETALSYLTADDPLSWQTTIAEQLSTWR